MAAKNPINGQFISEDITGQRFGRYLALKRGSNLGRHAAWECLCDCGKINLVAAGALRAGQSKGCRACRKKDGGLLRRTHGHTAVVNGRKNSTRVYSIWRGMLQRCRDENWQNYGERGIAVCERWNSFENFYGDMGEPPSARHSIERKDPNGDYCPDNCVWATAKEQARNRRNNRIVEFNGEALTIAEWSDRTGIKSATIHARLDRGWDIAKALAAPSQKRTFATRGRRMITANGQTMSLIQWAEFTGISAGAILTRIKAGWSEQDAATTPPLR